ncbi:unnamed protein product [Lota lota]
MALSQIQCLDENNVNLRTHEAKPEFLYCENQRLALEVLLRDGREAFHGFLKARELRGFLSDSEMEIVTRSVEPYDPGSDVLHSSPVEDRDDDVPLSLHYWPDLSDTSVPELDLGWPDSASYRGVTRTNVYTQPPQEGQAHIKEIVRKTIAQAQKVIAVVMDLFTDVDIFRDLLEAGYKRKVSVYILLEHSTLPHFLSMCDRANMHPGQLKNLRVRCAGGGEFLTRSCTRLRGRLGHRFMFVDGDKAVSGSYRYTWMSSRLDRHLITVVTGQAVDAFDRLFCELYGTSSAVDLKRVAMELEPEPELLPQPVAVAPSAEVARKRHNPMYALLGMGTNNANPASVSGPNSPINSNSQDKAGVGMKAKKKMAAKAAQVEAPPIHPGLIDLEKAYMILYLPTWPEPDPSSDVIGFINIRDHSRQTQVHMQRSERFETSQAIRFSSPFSMPKEILPEVAQLRQHATNLQDITGKKAYPTQVSPQEVAVDKAQPTSPNTRPSTLATQPSGQDVQMVLNKSVDMHILTSEPKINAEKQPVNTESKPSTNPATQQITTPHIDTPTSFSNEAPIIKTGSARTPDGHCCSSPDTRTPTPDTSDGYVSPRDDSTLSTTSDEYYECDESLHSSPVFDHVIGLDNRMAEDRFRAQTKYGGESEGESEREEYKVWIGEDRAAILAAGERSRTCSEGLSQTAEKGSHQLPLKIQKHEESIICLSPQRQSDPLKPVGVDGYPRSASAKKSADIETSPPPILRRSSSSASSENTVSPFITPVPSPAPTPTPKRAHPRAPPPDTEVVGRPAVVSSPGVQAEGKQVLRSDCHQESGELTSKWEEDLRRAEDPELVTKEDFSTSSGELHSETSALRTSGAQMIRGPWFPRETEGNKGLQSPPRTLEGRPKQQNHHSPTAKPARPTRPSSGPQSPRSYQQVSSKVDQDSPQTLHNNSAPQQPQYRRQSSMPAAGSLKGADQKSPSEAFSRRSLHYGQPLAGQGSGSLPKPHPSFLYTYTNSQSQLQPQTQPMIASDQMAQTVSSQQSTYRQDSAPEPGDSGQDLSKTGFSFSIGKLYSIKGLKNKGSSSPSQTKRNPDSSAQPRKSTG